uniref:Uncharacterized protein n=1 Tax=Arundo donax TaxID=35708 RepID=A0A0A9CWR1_ARUDO
MGLISSVCGKETFTVAGEEPHEAATRTCAQLHPAQRQDDKRRHGAGPRNTRYQARTTEPNPQRSGKAGLTQGSTSHPIPSGTTRPADARWGARTARSAASARARPELRHSSLSL